MLTSNALLLNDDCGCDCHCCELISESVTLYDPATSSYASSSGEGAWWFDRPDKNRGKSSDFWGSLYTNPKLCWNGDYLTIWIRPPVVTKGGKNYFFKRMKVTWGCDGEFTSGWVGVRAYTINLPACVLPEACTIALEAEYETNAVGTTCGTCIGGNGGPWASHPLIAKLSPTWADCSDPQDDCFLEHAPMVQSALPLVIPMSSTDLTECDVGGTASVLSDPFQCSPTGPAHEAGANSLASVDFTITWAGNVPTIVKYRLFGSAEVFVRIVGGSTIGSRFAGAFGGVADVVVNETLAAQTSPGQWCKTFLDWAVGKVSPTISDACGGSMDVTLY